MLLNTFDSMWRKKNSADYFHGNKFSAWYNDELYQLLQSDEKNMWHTYLNGLPPHELLICETTNWKQQIDHESIYTTMKVTNKTTPCRTMKILLFSICSFLFQIDKTMILFVF